MPVGSVNETKWYLGATLISAAFLGTTRLTVGGTENADNVTYTSGNYLAYASPWSTLPGGANDSLVHGVDYEDTIVVFPSTFPDDSVISWRWPTPGPGSVAGYMHIAYGNYDGGVVETPVTSWQVGNIDTFTETISLSLGGDTDDVTVLNEFYLTTAEGDEETDIFEIGFFLHATTESIAFFESGVLLGQFTDPQGRVWDVADCGPNPTGATFIVFLRANRADVLSGVLDKKAALEWLMTEEVIGTYHWVNGCAIGVEPYRGSGSMRVADYAVAFVGSGAALPTPSANLVVNGTFAAGDTGWSGFWFSGKDPSGGIATFTASPAFDGIAQSISFVAGKYYEVTYTLTCSAGAFIAQFSGGTVRNGTSRATNGTFTERMLANTGNDTLNLMPTGGGFTGTLDNVIVAGPYDTATVGGV